MTVRLTIRPSSKRATRRRPPLDYPIYFNSSLDDYLGDGEKILNTTIARPGLSWGGFSFAHVPIPSSCFPPLVRRPTASRRHFFAHVQQGRGEAKTQNRRKGHLQARHAVLRPYGYPYIPKPSNGLQRTSGVQTWHKATPARSVRSKPGYYYLLRAMDSTAQRSAVWSYQAQEPLMQPNILNTSSSDAPGILTVAPPQTIIGQAL